MVGGMATYAYEIVDVFTDRAFAGNPLAVVLEAEGLGDAQLAAIAREFNLSETAFVLPPTRAADYRVRIFTPARELPFAGHPSVGTAVTLARLGRIGMGDVVQECGAGLLPITIDGDQATLTGGAPTIGEELDPKPLLAAAGLTEADLVGLPSRTAGAGLDFTFLPVSDEAVGRASLDLAAARAHGVDKVYVFSWSQATGKVHGRLFGPGVGVLEDPATGSAAVGLGVWLAGCGQVPADAETPYVISQGAEIGRPSVLSCTVTTEGGAVVRTTVAGQVVPVASGRLTIR
jgi:trans-2,3-dihydro-3-hydroxyanthranilate isomerase